MPSLRRSHSDTPISGELPSPSGVGLQPVFGDEGLDHAVLDHQRIVEHRHLGHAAVGVARVDIIAEQRILLRARRRRHARGDEIAIDAGDALERAPRHELIDQDAHRHAGRAGIAIGHVGDVLAAPEPALQQIVDEEARLIAGEMREQLPLEPAGKIGTGLRRGDVEFGKVALVLCHVRPTGNESEPVPTASLVDERPETQCARQDPNSGPQP